MRHAHETNRLHDLFENAHNRELAIEVCVQARAIVSAMITLGWFKSSVVLDRLDNSLRELGF